MGAHGLSWSPDGQSLALPHTETSEGGTSIYLLSVETGKRRRLTAPPPEAGDWAPRFSPDGTNLAFFRGDGNGGEVYLVSVESGDERRLTSGEELVRGLDWTQDGASIVYSSNRPGRGGRLQPVASLGLQRGARASGSRRVRTLPLSFPARATSRVRQSRGKVEHLAPRRAVGGPGNQDS